MATARQMRAGYARRKAARAELEAPKRKRYVRAGVLDGISVRFHVERRYFRGETRDQDLWDRQTLAGARTLARARFDLADVRKDSPSYFKRRDFRIVKVTSIREIVAPKKRKPKRRVPLRVQCGECGAIGHGAAFCPGEDDGS